MDRFELISSFINGTTVKIGKIEGVISSLEREDGSGYNFNVRIYSYTNGNIPTKKIETIFARCR